MTAEKIKVTLSDGRVIEVKPITEVINVETGEIIKIDPQISHVDAVKSAVSKEKKQKQKQKQKQKGSE
jgi:hypothetical protein